MEQTGQHNVNTHGNRFKFQDILAPHAAMTFCNPKTRASSFNPVRGSGEELHGFQHRMLIMGQANARYPNFGGFWYDWDGAGAFNYAGLLVYFGVGNLEDDFRKWSHRRDQWVYDDFKRRTGLEHTTESDYTAFSLATGHPEFAPVLDYPCFKWLGALSKSGKFNSVDRSALEKRIDAFSSHVMNLYKDALASHQTTMHDALPSMRHTTSLNTDHNTVRNGHWLPGAYEPLDFRFMTCWNDQVGGPDYGFQWLLSAAILDCGRKPQQPTWIASALGTAHGRSQYPGKFTRVAAHDLAYGGTGIGLAMEGFSGVIAGMGDQQWSNIHDKSGGADLRAGRDFLDRFAALARLCQRPRDVGVLLSKKQFGRQSNLLYGYTPQVVALVALARLGYSPSLVTDDQIALGELKDVKTLVVVNQTVEFDPAVQAQLEKFTSSGGRLFVCSNTTAKLPGAKPVDIKLPLGQLGLPHNWSSPQSPTGNLVEYFENTCLGIMPAIYSALGEAGRTPLATTAAPKCFASTFGLRGGEAQYVIAVNDALANSHSCLGKAH